MGIYGVAANKFGRNYTMLRCIVTSTVSDLMNKSKSDLRYIFIRKTKIHRKERSVD
jgi:hypothetical protein